MTKTLDDAYETAFKITAAFEGGKHSYASLALNFDGALLSWGVIQWNLKSGTLQPLLRQMFKNGAATFRNACTVPVAVYGEKRDLTAELFNLLEMDYDQGLAWITAREDQFHRFRKEYSHWVTLFNNLAAVPLFQKIQLNTAMSSYMTPAVRLCKKYRMLTEHDLAFFYDLCVQCGSGSPTDASIKRMLAMGFNEAPTNQAKRLIIAQAVQLQDKRAWVQNDILMRKTCLALGGGIVHGTSYHLKNDFQLSDDVVIPG